MLKILERRIALQLLVFYAFFILPLLLGGVELYFFQRDALQQSAQRADMDLARSIAFTFETRIQAITEEAKFFANATSAKQVDLPRLTQSLSNANLSHPNQRFYIVCDPSGTVLLSYPFNQNVKNDHCSSHSDFQQALVNTEPVASLERFRNYPPSVSVATRIMSNDHPAGVIIVNLPLDTLSQQLMTIRQQSISDKHISIWLVDEHGHSFTGTEHTLPTPSSLQHALLQQSGNVIVSEQDPDWFYSFTSITDTPWKVVVGHPVEVILALLISFQHSLIIALIMLIIGASLFWFVIHGWVIAPLSRLARAVPMIKPDRTTKAIGRKFITKEGNRCDEIGQLITAFSQMEDEIHDLFHQSDQESQARLHTLDAIMQSMREGVILESSQGHIVYANQSFIQFIGLSPQAIQQPLLDTRLLSARLL
ncbi:MAG: hypothetical protein J2P36_27980, partial [Ktedonobacteraceae bacterium]|nr:hypothetical protein [Ktedonobacteraceae bacterium]